MIPVDFRLSGALAPLALNLGFMTYFKNRSASFWSSSIRIPSIRINSRSVNSTTALPIIDFPEVLIKSFPGTKKFKSIKWRIPPGQAEKG